MVFCVLSSKHFKNKTLIPFAQLIVLVVFWKASIDFNRIIKNQDEGRGQSQGKGPNQGKGGPPGKQGRPFEEEKRQDRFQPGHKQNFL